MGFLPNIFYHDQPARPQFFHGETMDFQDEQMGV